MTRVVFGISDWPENLDEEFEITNVGPNESDDEAIARAKECYNQNLKCVIREVN